MVNSLKEHLPFPAAVHYLDSRCVMDFHPSRLYPVPLVSDNLVARHTYYMVCNVHVYICYDGLASLYKCIKFPVHVHFLHDFDLLLPHLVWQRLELDLIFPLTKNLQPTGHVVGTVAGGQWSVFTISVVEHLAIDCVGLT